MNRKTPIIICLVIVISVTGGVVAWLASKDHSNEVQTSSTDIPNTPDSAVDTNESNENEASSNHYTVQDVAAHNTKDNCWTIINGDVYDLSAFIARHPGGDEIIRACGIDGSSLFNERRTAEGQPVGSGTPHDVQAQRELASLKIGTLKE